jgi:hypothetical protein
VTPQSRRQAMLRRRWLEILRDELARRSEEEDDDELREQRIAALEAQLALMAERLAATGGPGPREEASIAERLAVLMYLPQYLSAAEQEEEAAAIDAWFDQRYSGRRNRQ